MFKFISEKEQLEIKRRHLNELNTQIENAPKSFGRKETAIYSQALKLCSELEMEVN